eukprot:5111696-Pyramimonas_sp.AAC.1
MVKANMHGLHYLRRTNLLSQGEQKELTAQGKEQNHALTRQGYAASRSKLSVFILPGHLPFSQQWRR